MLFQAHVKPFRAFVTAAFIVCVFSYAPSQGQGVKLDVHFVPTPEHVVERMLEMAKVTKDDFVIDLGSGDGRIVIAAAKRGARGFGVDLDPQRIKEAIANAKNAGVEDRVTFRQQNLFKTDLSKASVLTMYLLTILNAKLRPHLLELKPGTRIASHAFDMGEWMPDRHEIINGVHAYLWIVPAKVQGRWQVQNGERTFTVEIKQQFQMIEGTAQFGDTYIPLRETALRGNEIRFLIEDDNGVSTRFHGRIDGHRIEAVPPAAGVDTPRPAGNWQASQTS